MQAKGLTLRIGVIRDRKGPPSPETAKYDPQRALVACL